MTYQMNSMNCNLAIHSLWYCHWKGTANYISTPKCLHEKIVCGCCGIGTSSYLGIGIGIHGFSITLLTMTEVLGSTKSIRSIKIVVDVCLEVLNLLRRYIPCSLQTDHLSRHTHHSAVSVFDSSRVVILILCITLVFTKMLIVIDLWGKRQFEILDMHFVLSVSSLRNCSSFVITSCHPQSTILFSSASRHPRCSAASLHTSIHIEHIYLPAL